MTTLRRVVLLLAISPVLAVAQLRPPSAQRPPGPQVNPPPEPGSELTVTLLTMGVGEQVWEMFGHNALWFHVDRPPSLGGPVDVVYNWGIFDSSQPHFIPHFLQKRMYYSMGGYPLQQTLIEYREMDRAVWAQELDLTNAQKLALRDFVIWNSRPENANYWYDYYLDNCSTRLRDALDRVLGGVIRATFSGRKTSYTYRSETLRLTQRQKLLAAGIDLGLGRPADHQLSEYEAMFLPMRLRDYIRELRIEDGHGGTRPLVKSERMLLGTIRHPEPTAPPRWMPAFLAVGVLVAVIFVLVGLGLVRGSGARIGAGVFFTTWAFGVGILGVILTLLWSITDHHFSYQNENLLLFNPLWLLLVVFAPMTVVAGRLSGTTRRLTFLLAGLGVLALLLHVIGLSRQANGTIIAFGLPPMLALAWAVHRSTAPARTIDRR
ncbi:MAG TPA: DUF4105 domain-containing protein [Gemmatimonadaceae bacterium]|nr:DUF4105 domain-containing protein [Gemmatimonadaceae bacterium]